MAWNDLKKKLSLDEAMAEAASRDPAIAQAEPMARAAQAGVRAIESGPSVDKAPMEGVEPDYNSPIDLLAGAYGAKLGSAMARDAGAILGNEVGAIRLAGGKEPWYHGTTSEHFDLKDMKPSQGAYGKGMYFADTPDVADIYNATGAAERKGAAIPNARTLPVTLPEDKMFIYEDSLAGMKEAAKKLGYKDYDAFETDRLGRAFYPEDNFNEILKEKGFLGKIAKNPIPQDDKGKLVKQAIIFDDPKHIQSVYEPGVSIPDKFTNLKQELNTKAPLQLLDRDAAIEQGLKIPKAHTPSREIDGRVFGKNYRLDNIDDINYAVQDGKVVGHLGVDDNGAVKAVYTSPSARRQGVAEKLYEDYATKYGQLHSDDPAAMEPEAKALWDKLMSKYPQEITKDGSGYHFLKKKLEQPEGLDMSEAARMARAKEMGFDTGKTYYHGTKANIDEFKLPKKASNGSAFGEGVYLTDAPYEANHYAMDMSPGESGSNVLPVHHNLKNPFDLDANVDPKFIEYLKENKVLPQSYLNQVKDNFGLYGKLVNKLDGHEYTELLKKAGYDGVSNAPGKGGYINVVFDPSQIRSKFAAFDPSKSGSGNISAGLAGAALLGNQDKFSLLKKKLSGE